MNERIRCNCILVWVLGSVLVSTQTESVLGCTLLSAHFIVEQSIRIYLI